MRKNVTLVVPSGFTLIELLVALTLMALLSVILFGGLRFGVRAWDAGGQRIGQVSQIEAVQNLLRREVSQARLAPRTADPTVLPGFAGTSDELTFVAPLPSHRGVGGSYLFQLDLQDHDGRADLALTWRLYRPESDPENSALAEDGTTLLEDVADIELSYYGAPVLDQPAQWLDSWDGANGKPQLVRMRLEFPSGDARRWPDLIIRLP